MQGIYLTGRTFDRNDFTVDPPEKGEYEQCVFKNCNFAGQDLSEFRFIDCVFTGCDLSLVKLNGTALRDIRFTGCKMVGLWFDSCNEFGLSFSFDGCQLNHTSFFRTKIKKTVFRNSQLQETDFSECDLTGSLFDNCDLAGASFDNTNLEKADFRTSYNYILDPELNRIKKARFSVSGLPGLLNKYDIVIEP